MAGHSHWAGIKHKKALIDNKRGKLWSKLARQIIVAARMGGGDPDANIRLRKAIADARAVSMPNDNIERAIKKGTGELDGGNVEEVLYEGYGPGGVAVMCEIMTDNRNRTAPEIRKVFETCGGNLGGTGCVAYLFERKGQFLFDPAAVEEEAVMLAAMEAGGEDVRHEEGQLVVTCSPDAFAEVSAAFEAAGLETVSQAVVRLPNMTVEVDDPEIARKVLRLMELLDDHDDVQQISANFNITDRVMAEIGEE